MSAQTENSESSFSAEDAFWMAKAIKLAEQGKYTTSPNPNVGCVLVNHKGELLAEGYHLKAGEPHAEINALNQLDFEAAGATAYVTLEPCSHYGRTPPCADALIKANVAKVVIAMQDPNPQVAGNGIKRLKAAGIEVQCGLMQQEAMAINRGFVKRHTQGRPWVTVKLAMSLDGKIALSNGVSQWITGAEARSDVQRHRAQSCAILSGSGTVLIDNPSLNVRYQELGLPDDILKKTDLRQPTRVILDGRNQLAAGLKTLQLPGQVIVINSANNPKLPDSVKQISVPHNGNKLALDSAMKRIADENINELWVEAGARMAGALLQHKLVDELIVYIAPKIMGDKAISLVDLPEFKEMDDVLKLAWKHQQRVGDDLKLTACLVQ